MCSLTALPFPITNKLSIDRSVIHVAQFFQYELCWIKAVLDRLLAEHFIYALTRADLRGPTRTLTYPREPSCTCLYPSVASSSDSLPSASHQADVMLAAVKNHNTFWPCLTNCFGGVKNIQYKFLWSWAWQIQLAHFEQHWFFQYWTKMSNIPRIIFNKLFSYFVLFGATLICLFVDQQNS